jgi:hypothetical protein
MGRGVFVQDIYQGRVGNGKIKCKERIENG